MDGQIQWDPYATSEPQQGITSMLWVTTVALAPVKNGDEDALVKSFSLSRGDPALCLGAGRPLGWHSYGDYLDRLDGRLGINVAGLGGARCRAPIRVGRRIDGASGNRGRNPAHETVGAGSYRRRRHRLFDEHISMIV